MDHQEYQEVRAFQVSLEQQDSRVSPDLWVHRVLTVNRVIRDRVVLPEQPVTQGHRGRQASPDSQGRWVPWAPLEPQGPRVPLVTPVNLDHLVPQGSQALSETQVLWDQLVL